MVTEDQVKKKMADMLDVVISEMHWYEQEDHIPRHQVAAWAKMLEDISPAFNHHLNTVAPLPCPWCGPKPSAIKQPDITERGEYFQVECLRCGALGPKELDEDEAATSWNRKLMQHGRE